MKILEQLGIYGWALQDENLMLASLLTGDPLLMIGAHGSAKTHVAYKISAAMNKRFLAYDASKSLFEDVLGFPNVEALKRGVVEYVHSAVTVWDKEFILIDEVNRALPELQSKWMEIIRSRKIMGFPTDVKTCWAAMNPMGGGYTGTQVMDAALIGRFSIFLYPPEALDMEEGDRIKVVQLINGDDAPAMSEWVKQSNSKTIDYGNAIKTGDQIKSLLTKAGSNFIALQKHFLTLGEFLAKFSVLVLKETNNVVKLDGRRLGFMYRNLLAVRAIEIARNGMFKEELSSFSESAKKIMLSSIPIGINEDGGITKDSFFHKVEICLDLLAEYFNDNADLVKTEIIYRLFTCDDLLEKVRILIQEDLTELAKMKAWNDLADSKENIAIIAYIALQVETRRPGTVPNELMEKLSSKITQSSLNTMSSHSLKEDSVEHIEEVEALLEQSTDMGKMIAYSCVTNLTLKSEVTLKDIAQAKEKIAANIEIFEKMMKGEEHGH